MRAVARAPCAAPKAPGGNAPLRWPRSAPSSVRTSPRHTHSQKNNSEINSDLESETRKKSPLPVPTGPLAPHPAGAGNLWSAAGAGSLRRRATGRGHPDSSREGSRVRGDKQSGFVHGATGTSARWWRPRPRRLSSRGRLRGSHRTQPDAPCPVAIIYF